MTMLAYALTPEQVVLAADSGVVQTAPDPGPEKGFPSQVMELAPKWNQVRDLPLVWGLAGDGADIRRFREWVDGATADTWTTLAESAAAKVLDLYAAAQDRAHRARIKRADIQGSTVLMAGVVDGKLDVVLLTPTGSPYFAAEYGGKAGAVGVYGPTLAVAGRAAQEFCSDLSLCDPNTLSRLVGVLCDKLPGLERPVTGCTLTRGGVLTWWKESPGGDAR